MDCSTCKNPMEKEHLDFNSKDKVSLVTLWKCEKCGHRERSQRDIPKSAET